MLKARAEKAIVVQGDVPASGIPGRVATSEMSDAHDERVMDFNARSVLAATRSAPPG